MSQRQPQIATETLQSGKTYPHRIRTQTQHRLGKGLSKCGAITHPLAVLGAREAQHHLELLHRDLEGGEYEHPVEKLSAHFAIERIDFRQCGEDELKGPIL